MKHRNNTLQRSVTVTDDRPYRPRRLRYAARYAYREDEMRAMLSSIEWVDYAELDTETQVLVAHLVLSGTPYDEAKRSRLINVGYGNYENGLVAR